MKLKRIKEFLKESQMQIDFSGKLKPEVLNKLKEKEEIAKKAIEKWSHDSYKKVLSEIRDIIDGNRPFSWDSHISVQGDDTKNDYDIFKYGNSNKIAKGINKILDKYSKYEVEDSSTKASAGWSGNMRSTISGSITPVVNYIYRAGYYGSDKNILIGVKVGSGIDSEIRSKIFQECYELLYPMDQYNSSDGGVSIFIDGGTNWKMIGLSCSKYSFNDQASERLLKIMKG